MVTVIVTGHKEVVDVNIKEEVMDPEDIEMLQDLVLAATNDALKKAEELTNQYDGTIHKRNESSGDVLGGNKNALS